MSIRRGYQRLPMYVNLRLVYRTCYEQRPTFANRNYSRNSPSNYSRNSLLRTLIKITIGAVILSILFGYYLYEPNIEISFYSRSWVQHELRNPPAPLSGECFSFEKPYPNSTIPSSSHIPEVHAGLAMQLGLDCYAFAGTISPPPSSNNRPLPVNERTHFHTYWRTDLAAFQARQEWMLKSFFATQNLSKSLLILWSNGDLSGNPILQKYLRRYPDAFALQIVNLDKLAVGTALEGSRLLHTADTKAWVDGDVIRLMLLWNYGGVWVDMDSLLTRDLEPLLAHEFVTQWDCYDKIYQPLNGALMRFHKHSPYLCEAFHLMAASAPPRPGSTDWGSILYHKLWRRLVTANIVPFKILPYCFSDGRSCRLDNRLPDPFVPDVARGRWNTEEGGSLDAALSMVFGVHLHNQWRKEFPHEGWVHRLLLKRFDQKLLGRL